MASRRPAPTVHTVRLTEEPIADGRIRIGVECPDGCVRGYLYSFDPEHNDDARAMAQAAADAHAARRPDTPVGRPKGER